MGVKVRLPRCKIRFSIFIAYNLLYVIYMMGYCSQLLYLGTLIIFCCMNAFCLLRNGRRINKALREFKLGMGYIGVFLIVSVFFQVIHMDFQMYLVSGLIRITLPIVNAFLFVNSVREEDQQYFFNVLLVRFIFHFIWANYSYLNLAGLHTISWSNSSSVMESSLAHDFIIMEMYYLYRKDKKKALMCCLLCMLSMKRLSFILAPLLFVISGKIPKDTEVNNKLTTALKSIAIISPFFILFLYSDLFQNWFFSTFHVGLNIVMSGRPAIYETLKNNIPYYNGYGSINNFMERFVRVQFGTKWNAVLHNDFLRIYFETTIVGVIILANNLVKISKKNYWHFIMMSYLFLVAITSHIFNYFSVWITIYMIIMSSNNNAKADKGVV